MLLTDGPVRHNYDAIPLNGIERSSSMETVLYYGFTPIKSFRSSSMDSSATRAVSSIDSVFGNPAHDKRCFSPKEKASLIRLYKNGHFSGLPTPVMLYQEKIHQNKKNKGAINQKCGFDILGVSGSIAEALAIRASFAVLEEDGFENLEVEINSVGDRPSREAFERDISLYVRGLMNKIPEKIRPLCRKNPYAIFTAIEEDLENIIEEAPKPINYLSEESRTHLREILEYMEELGVPYTINHRLIAHRALHGHTIFRIVSTEPDSKNGSELISAYGMRYNPLSRRLGYQKSTPAVGAYLAYKRQNKNKKNPNSKKPVLPEFCFVHLGSMAKQKSLKVIDMLRHNRIPICHYLTKDKLAGQMNTVEKLKMPYLLIMGHKEALEGTVMVRNMEDRSQETVPLDNLLPYLKKIRSSGRRASKKLLNQSYPNERVSVFGR